MKTHSFLSSRNIGLDLLRAGLIIEGVLLHASRSLPGENSWYYTAQRDPAELFTALLGLFHTFRMEVFFFLSGMFSALIILRKGQRFFITNRRKRVLVPLITAYIFIPPLMYAVGGMIDNKMLTWEGCLESYGVMHHLWFLISLSIMSLLIPIAFYDWSARQFGRLSLPVLMALLIALGNVGFMLKFLVKEHGDFAELLPITARFLVYYAAGYALYVNREQISRYANSKLMNGWVIGALMALVWFGFYVVAHFHVDNALKYLPVLVGSVLSVMLSYWLVFTFERIQVKENRLLTAIVDSALIIYLLHYPVVVVSAWLIDDWLPANLSVSYVLLDCLIGIVVSAMFYWCIKRSRLASWLFGLKPKAKKMPVPIEARL
ncbi:MULTISPECIES: acyltransferase family protein [unclassified Pantoea]|uniref:acyltransferase family protein n=1 Tax=unclassified Pantoea TaxID=2630326 RepID=UPI001CD587AD|nr:MULTISPECIES: acyltransferase family protein [unclassified Pantoea]MCA1177955.1 acyltransferase family protein [Pantoea sp. alder69]MCA1253097.1 acyltransferase family protein [Pantoea sp. alder70]MCA1266281.1 acyltransferase family protein [Pantoea sp. alder81]